MSLPSRSSVGFWGFLTVLTALTFVRIDLHARPSAVSEPGEGLAAVQAAVVPVVASLAAPKPHRHVIADTLGPDESIYLALKRHRVSDLQITLLSTALTPVFEVRKDPKPGDFFQLELDSLHAVARFEYTPVKAPDRPVLVERQAEELVARRWQRPVTETTETLRIFIEDNLFNAIAAAGESDALTDMVVDDVFGSVIDFHTVPRHGDRLGLIFTRQSVDGRFLRYGKILMARYEGEGLSRVGVYYEDPTGAGDYYDESGESLERMFLLKPMSFRRISSPFARRRFHPILKRAMPHLGTDYAAAPGTPVWSTAHGVVTQAGWSGGYGKMVEIKHANGYRTRYAHLSRILVRKGQRVSKSDHVGHVGATGRATGPHLHYELIQNGRHINPSSVNRGGGRPLATEYGAAFHEHYRTLRERLEKATGVTGPLLAAKGP